MCECLMDGLRRFHLEDPVTKVVGDLREEFGFSTLFPDIGKLRSVSANAGLA